MSSAEDICMAMISKMSTINIPFVSVVFKKDEIDRIANDHITYARLPTDKCPVTSMRRLLLFGVEQMSAMLYNRTYHIALYDDDKYTEIQRRKYISDCLEKRVTNKEIRNLRRILQTVENPEIILQKEILAIFLRRFLKTKGDIAEIDDLLDDKIPVETTTSHIMSKYKLHGKLPQVELLLLTTAVKRIFVPLVIANESVRFTKRSNAIFTFRVCVLPNNENIPVGNIVVLLLRPIAYLYDDPRYVWGVGTEHRHCATRDFSIDLFEKLTQSRML